MEEKSMETEEPDKSFLHQQQQQHFSAKMGGGGGGADNRRQIILNHQRHTIITNNNNEEEDVNISRINGERVFGGRSIDDATIHAGTSTKREPQRAQRACPSPISSIVGTALNQMHLKRSSSAPMINHFYFLSSK
jgi:hypothetical protein